MKKINLLRFDLMKDYRKKNIIKCLITRFLKAEYILIFVNFDALSVIMF